MLAPKRIGDVIENVSRRGMVIRSKTTLRSSHVVVTTKKEKRLNGFNPGIQWYVNYGTHCQDVFRVTPYMVSALLGRSGMSTAASYRYNLLCRTGDLRPFLRSKISCSKNSRSSPTHRWAGAVVSNSRRYLSFFLLLVPSPRRKREEKKWPWNILWVPKYFK